VPLQLSVVVVGTTLNAVGEVETGAATAGGTEAAFNTASRSLSIVVVESGLEGSSPGEEQEKFEKEFEEEVVVVVEVVAAVSSRGRCFTRPRAPPNTRGVRCCCLPLLLMELVLLLELLEI
jgi:hypothetical protein